jgi:hypothetical protein
MEGEGTVKHYEWRLFDVETEEQHAGGTAGTQDAAEADARHYTMQYARDGPVMCEVYEVRMVESWSAGKKAKR